LRAQKRKVTTRQQGLIGAHGVVIEWLAAGGLVKLGGEVWSAVGEAEAEIGTEVEITGVTGLTLRVRPLAKEAEE